MSRQLNFFLTPTDLSDMADRLARSCDLAVLKSDSEDERPVEVKSLLIKEMGKEDLQVYLCKKEEVEQVKMRENSKAGKYFVDEQVSAVISCFRCFMNEEVIRRGRLYAVTSYFDKHDRNIRKDKEFLGWISLIFRAAKRNLIYQEGIYMGHDAMRLGGTRNTAHTELRIKRETLPS